MLEKPPVRQSQRRLVLPPHTPLVAVPVECHAQHWQAISDPVEQIQIEAVALITPEARIWTQ
jgi:hypothetical protein